MGGADGISDGCADGRAVGARVSTDCGPTPIVEMKPLVTAVGHAPRQFDESIVMKVEEYVVCKFAEMTP